MTMFRDLSLSASPGFLSCPSGSTDTAKYSIIRYAECPCSPSLPANSSCSSYACSDSIHWTSRRPTPSVPDTNNTKTLNTPSPSSTPTT